MRRVPLATVLFGALLALVGGSALAAAPRVQPVRTKAPGQPRLRILKHAPRQVVGFNFDIDDNILRLPTQIWLRNAATGKEQGVSTQAWAIVRHAFAPNAQGTALVGSGGYAGFEIGLDTRTGGLRDFYDNGRGNTMLRDLERQIAAGGWRGPSWNAFVAAMKRPETARRTTLITARGHSAESIHAVLRHLQRLGHIKYVPPRENIFPVLSPRFMLKGQVVPGDAAAKKGVVMASILDEIEHNGLRRTARDVVTPDGRGRKKMHLWGFSDDDYGNYQKALAVLSEGVKQGRWPNVKIKVFYTGTNNPAQKPGAVVIMPDGTTRPERADERREVTSIVGPFATAPR